MLDEGEELYRLEILGITVEVAAKSYNDALIVVLDYLSLAA